MTARAVAAAARPAAEQAAAAAPPGTYDARRLFKLAAERPRALLAANALAALATLVAAPVPLLIPLLVDEVLLDKPGATVATIDALFPGAVHGAVFYIVVVSAATVLLRLFSWAFATWQARIFFSISKDLVYRIRRRILSHLGVVAVSEYDNLGGGSVASRLVTDLNTLDDFLGVAVGRFVVSALSILLTAVILLFLHWPLALFLLFLNPLVVYFTMLLGKQVKRLKARENKAVELFQEAITETLSAMHQIRADNRDRYYFGRLAHKAGEVKDRATRFAWRTDSLGRLSFLVFLVGFDVFRALGMLMVLFSDLSIGQMIAVFGYLWFMLGPIQEVLGMQYAWYGAKAAIERINTLVALPREAHYPALENPFAQGATVGLEVRDLALSYDGENNILDGVSLKVEAGEKVALVGASGGGKTTLVRALLGLHAHDAGEILYGGAPIERVGYEAAREHVGCVLQHPSLFNASIRENLLLGREADEASLWRALQVAQIDDFVKSCAQGLDTVVGAQGVKLSGGQRQRLAIARMLLTEPSAVILDEATSSLDSETERRLHRALFEELRDKTMLIVAHRLSAVRQADRIYVFEAGRIAEQGRHDSLLKERGLYARLFATQV